MARDGVTPLATVQSLQRSTLRHLVAGLETDELRDALVRATRACETWAGRRLAPFTALTETHRATGVDPTQAPGGADLGSVASVASAGYGRAVGSAGQVRQVWLDQCAPLYPEMWAYSGVTITLLRPEGSTAAVASTDLLGAGPDAETGLLWFRTGTYLPPGSRVRVTYSGGYQTVPSDLAQACRYMLAADVIDEDDYPGGGPSASSRDKSGTGRGDGGFLGRAQALLAPYRAA